MPLFGRGKKDAPSPSRSKSPFARLKQSKAKGTGKKETEASPPASPPLASSSPPPLDIWNGPHSVFYTVRDPWQWVAESLTSDNDNLNRVGVPSELPTGRLTPSDSTASLTPSRRRRKKAPKPSTLKLEVVANQDGGELLAAAHGSSEAFDGLEDKDELVRTMQRCRCEDLELSPPSKLINWDATKEECLRVVGEELPSLSAVKTKKGEETRIAVLKEPMGTRGTGIYFVKDVNEIVSIIDEHRKRANDEPEFLDNLIAVKGRIPSWVLQAEVRPCLLIKGRRKFHIRTYVVAVEKLETEELMEVFVFNRHEVRIAAEPIPDDVPDDWRERKAHITNGAMSNTTERALLSDVPELMEISLQQKLEEFVSELFGKHFVPDMTHRVKFSASQDPNSLEMLNKFAIAGLDIMVTETGRLYLLEANVNPAAPPEDTVEGAFKEHLAGFMSDLMDLVIGRPSPNFIPCKMRVSPQA